MSKILEYLRGAGIVVVATDYEDPEGAAGRLAGLLGTEPAPGNIAERLAEHLSGECASRFSARSEGVKAVEVWIWACGDTHVGVVYVEDEAAADLEIRTGMYGEVKGWAIKMLSDVADELRSIAGQGIAAAGDQARDIGETVEKLWNA